MHLQPVRVNAMYFLLVSVSVAVYVFLLHIGSDDEGLNVNFSFCMCHQFVFMYRLSRDFVTVRVLQIDYPMIVPDGGVNQPVRDCM